MKPLENADESWARQLLESVLTRAESVSLETKRVSGKMVGKALETICAFANTQGGWLILGVEDAGKEKGQARLYGIGENPEAVDEPLRKLGTHHLPAIEGVRAFRLSTPLRDDSEGVIVALHVPASDKVHSILDDGTWTRG